VAARTTSGLSPNLIRRLRIQASRMYALECEAGHALDCHVVSQERMMQASILCRARIEP
jgi:hypothetical protein